MFYSERCKEIGMRIKNERKSKKWTQADLLTRLKMSPTSVASVRNWENGNILPELDTLARMADVFDCDIGYLLCDYNQRNRNTADVCAITGLTGAAVNQLENSGSALIMYPTLKTKSHIDILSAMLESPHILEFFNHLGYYLIHGIGFTPDDFSDSDISLTAGEWAAIHQKVTSRACVISKQQDIRDMHLQSAADTLKIMFREILRNEQEVLNNGKKK